MTHESNIMEQTENKTQVVTGIQEVYEAVKKILDEYVPSLKLDYISTATGRFLTVEYKHISLLFLDTDNDNSISIGNKDLLIDGINFDQQLIVAIFTLYIRHGILEPEAKRYLYKIVINNRQTMTDALQYFSTRCHDIFSGYNLYRSSGKKLVDRALSIIQLNSMV